MAEACGVHARLQQQARSVDEKLEIGPEYRPWHKANRLRAYNCRPPLWSAWAPWDTDRGVIHG